MRAILIDPFNETVTEVDSTGNLDSIYALTQTDIVQAVNLDLEGADPNYPDSIYVDEEALLRDLSKQKFFTMAGWPEPLAGRGLILNLDDEGNSAPARVSLAELAPTVKFYDLAGVRALMG